MSEYDFACTCEASGRREVAQTIRWALDFLSVKQREFCTAAIAALDWRYGAGIDHIGFDQWGGLFVGTFPLKDGKSEFGIFVQFDDFEGGLAYALRQFYDRYGEKRPR